MATTMTPGERQAMDDLSDYASKTWGVYLFSGIVSILFGVLVLSLEIDWSTVRAVASPRPTWWRC